MKPPPLFPAGLIVSCRLAGISVALIFLIPLNLQGDAPPTTLRLKNTGADTEGLQTFQLEWNALSNTTYLVQSADRLAPGSPWQTLDAVKPRDAVGTYQLQVVATDSTGQPSSNKFYRLVLPQPEITGVEPAVVDVTVPNTPLYILGQCLPTNVLVVINGHYFTPTVVNTGGVWAVVSLNGLPPGEPWLGLTVIDAGTSNVVATLPNSVLGVDASSPYLLEPPELPPASPEVGASSRKFRMKWDPKNQGAMAAAFKAVRGDFNGDGLDSPGLAAPGVPPIKGDWNADGFGLAEFGGDEMDRVGSRDRVFRNQFDADVVGFSGEVQQQVQDFQIPGHGLDFNWTRTYRSRSTTNSSLGTHWTHSYDVRVQPVGGDILIHDGTGRADRFFLQTNGTYTCPGFFREGTLSNNVFRLTFADTGYWEFNPLDGSGTAGKLRKIVDRNTNTVSLFYDAQNRCDRVVDPLGRTNTISYNPAGRPASVTDFSGRTVTYQYYTGLPSDPGGSAGDLKSVTSPPVTGTPNGNDFPAGKTTTYTYSTGYANELENHLLLSVTDALGQTASQHVYQHNQSDFDFLRCISIQRWTNIPARFSYLSQTPTPSNQFATLRCVMNDPVGNVTEYFYDARNRCVKMQEFTGRATPGVAVTDTANRPTGKVRATDPNYYESRWSWNNDSLCTLEVAPGGQQLQCIYESDFDKSTRARKRADCRVVREIATTPVDLDGDGLADVSELVSRYDFDPRFGSDPGATPYGRRQYTILDAQGMHRGGGNPTPDRGRRQHQPFAIWHPTDPGELTIRPYFHPFANSTRGAASFCTVATDPRGNGTLIGYDKKGNPTNRVEKTYFGHSGYLLDVAYNPQGELIAITNAPDANNRRRVDTFAYSQGQVVQCVVDAGAGGLGLTNTFERDARGNVTRYVDARGNDWLYTYNALDQCVRVQTPVNLTARSAMDYFYDANNNLVQTATEVRDATDTLTGSKVDQCVVDPLHRVTRILLAVDTTHSLTNDFIYDGNNQLVLLRGGDAVSGADPHQAIAFQSDERGLLYREIAAPGGSNQTTAQSDYDANGNPIRVSEGLEGTPSMTTIEHDGFAGFDSVSPTSSTRRRSGPNAVARARNGVLALARPSKITDPMGNVTMFNFDANDNLKVIRHFGQTNDVAGTNGNRRLAESRYEYDALNRPIRARDLFFNVSTQAPIGDGERTTTFDYAPNGQCTSTTDDLGRTTTFAYDTVGWLASRQSPGARTIYLKELDRAGNVTRTVQTDQPDLGGPPQMFTRTNVYDSLNRCISTTDNVGNTNRFAYNSMGCVVKHTDPRGNQTLCEYDLLGRPTVRLIDLDGDGVPSSVDRVTHIEWGDMDVDGPLSVADSHGNTTSYSYDSIGRCTSITNADGTRLSLVWSPRSNLIQETDPNGTVILHTYDLNDRCISNHITPGPTVATTTTFETFAYDGCSRLVAATNDASHTEMEYDSIGDVPGNHRDGWNVLSAYDSMGRRTSLTYPGGRVLTYAYDLLDQVTNVVESGASLASISYDGPGRVSRVNYGNGTRAQVTYDGVSGVPNASGDFGHVQLTSVTHGIAGTATNIAAVNLKWDRNGNKTARTDMIFAPAIPRTNDLGLIYDAADQLIGATLHSGSSLLRDTTYGFDTVGNRSNVTGAASCSGNYFMNGLVPGPMDYQMNQYTTTPCDSRSYDENGNLIGRGAGPGSFFSYSYDCYNRLVSVLDSGSLVAAYSYDALGHRISKTLSGGAGLPPVTTEFIYDGDGVIEERESGAVTASFVLDGTRSHDDEVVKSWTWKQVSGPFTMRRGGQDYYFHNDDQGNVLALSSTGGAVVERYDYDDYGAVTFLSSDGVPTGVASSSVGNVYCWGGLRLDSETGLQNDDGDGYLETQSGSSLARAQDDLQRTGSIVQLLTRNNPWTGDGGGAYSKKNRADLYDEFKNGDIPNENDFKDVIDSSLNFVDDGLTDYSASGKLPRPVLKEFFQSGDKPTAAQFGSFIDSMVNIVEDRYLLGLRTYDTAVCPGGNRIWPKPGYWSAKKADKDMVLKGKKILQN